MYEKVSSEINGMIKFTHLLLFSFGSQILYTLAEQLVKSEDNGQELLLCRKCGTDVADSYYLFSHLSPGARKSQKRKLFGKNVTVQTLVNPFGVQFDVITTEKARCNNMGHPQGADSWFPGYSWQICTCPHCGAHLGWTFENSSMGTTDKPISVKTFHGLILSNILGENCNTLHRRYDLYLRFSVTCQYDIQFHTICRHQIFQSGQGDQKYWDKLLTNALRKECVFQFNDP